MGVFLSKRTTGFKYDLVFDEPNVLGSHNINFYLYGSSGEEFHIFYNKSIKIVSSKGEVDIDAVMKVNDFIEENLQLIKNYFDKKITKEVFSSQIIKK